jgi:lysophospholipid acyltransferase (LPLAT)-like uncharacterized protein
MFLRAISRQKNGKQHRYFSIVENKRLTDGRVAQAGVVRLAQITKAWILPISFSSSWPLFLTSWDRQLVPKPFSRNVVAYGEPFAIPSDMPDDIALAKIRIALDDVTAEADAHTGTRPPS